MAELTQEQIEMMKESLDNGIEFAKEQIDSISNFIIDLWKRIKQAFMKVAELFRRWLKTTLRIPAGYKRLAKVKELAYYESISKGKSNNWRKYHGLYLIRNNC